MEATRSRSSTTVVVVVELAVRATVLATETKINRRVTLTRDMMARTARRADLKWSTHNPLCMVIVLLAASSHVLPLKRASGNLGPFSLHQSSSQRCGTGPPIQWRPYLDAAGKTHLAPAVALAKLRNFNLTPIQLSGNAPVLSLGQPLTYHPQNIDNVGVNIDATFEIFKFIKRNQKMNLPKDNQTIKLFYRVSASLSTTSALMMLASSNPSPLPNVAQSESYVRGIASGHQMHPNQIKQLMTHRQKPEEAQLPCSLELSEYELMRKVGPLFKKNQTYILFLDQVIRSQKQVRVGADELLSFYPFATHELLTNQTIRAAKAILCSNCAQVPQVQLVNATVVSVTQPNSQRQPIGSQPTWDAPNETPINGKDKASGANGHRIRLDCRVTGYPAPWVQWFKNGKLLRNKPGRQSMRTSKVKGRHNVRLSRLELELQPDRNETGVYECRAMNVVAREPVVGVYTLVEHREQYALIPMQPLAPVDSEATQTSQPLRQTTQAPAQFSQMHTTRTGQGLSTTTMTTTTMTTKATATTMTTTSYGIISGQVRPSASSTVAPSQSRHISGSGGGTSSATTTTIAAITTTTQSPSDSQREISSKTSPSPSSSSHKSQPVVGQSCPREAHDNFCLNKGTCVLIGHIEEYFCNCAEGYHGHRCQYKSLGHQQAMH